MAEIKVEKKSSPIWPWILGILVLVALLLYFFVFANDDTDDDINDDTTTEQVIEEKNYDNDLDEASDEKVNAKMIEEEATDVVAYNRFISDPNMGLDHEFASGALTKLIAATRATAEAVNVNIEADLAEAKVHADKITNDPSSLKHANIIKDAGKSITKALRTIQMEKFPEMEGELKNIQDAISGIDVNKPTLDQKNTIKSFFDNAGNLLTNINNNYEKQ